MEVNSWLTGRRGISLPFTDECSALGVTPDDAGASFQKVISLAGVRQWKYYELRGGTLGSPDAPKSVSYLGHQLELLPDPAALFARFDSSVRRAIRKADQTAVTVEFLDSLEAIRTFYRLLCKTRQRHGLPPQPFRFFENIHRYIVGNRKGTVAIASHEGNAVAGAVFFEFGKTVLYKFGASDESFQHLRGNNLVFWKAIERYCLQGMSLLDFGRTSLSNDGLRRFKLSWGSRERAIDYINFSFKENSFVSSTDQSSSQWYSGLFRHIPEWLSRIIGAAAYKHLA